MTREDKIKKAIAEIDCDTLEWMDDDGEVISDEIRDLRAVAEMVLDWYDLKIEDLTSEEMLELAESYISAREAIGW